MWKLLLAELRLHAHQVAAKDFLVSIVGDEALSSAKICKGKFLPTDRKDNQTLHNYNNSINFDKYLPLEGQLLPLLLGKISHV